ncbi:rod shape-determining protein [Planococcus lenghuensis]|uniref:Uncharacterized protein n=1 Tax=Planococcus lenghuensis TaxID=2213202 RepID=A0A1Q2L1I2_9BACL|nr:rod shape-determining protein [Planococcus lenghuensis]AQQ54266.1 hypothetical protein B0X71_14950 [Planococcus lenghuensis]
MSEQEHNLMELEEAISREILLYIKHTYRLLIDDPTANSMKDTARRSTAFLQTAGELDIRGRNLVSGLPETVRIRPQEIKQALRLS